MSRDAGKCSLLSEAVLQKAVRERVLPGEPMRIVKKEGIDFDKVLELHLENRSILMISNLWEFTSLTKLFLNRNLITKILHLDHLVHLTWLDLSFNGIEQIEGLETLQKLQVLDLSHNRISVIENMDSLEQLTIFSVANNLVGDLSDVLYLRRFKSLFSLGIHGNPVAQDDDYKLMLTAYLPHVTLLDNRHLEEGARDAAAVQHADTITKLEDDDEETQRIDDSERKRAAEVQLHEDAFVEQLNGPQLFQSLFDDPSSHKLRCLSGVVAMRHTYENQMVALCVDLFDLGLEELERRQAEVKMFMSARAAAVADGQRRGSQMLAEAEEQLRQRRAELQQLTSLEQLKLEVENCNEEISLLSRDLMTLAFELIIQLEDITAAFDMNLSDMVNTLGEEAKETFAQCQILEENYHKELRHIAKATLDAVARGDADIDLSPDMRKLFSSKRIVMDMLTSGHDGRLEKVGDRETQLLSRMDDWKTALIREVEQKNQKQHRRNITDVIRYVDYLREELQKLQANHSLHKTRAPE